MFTEGRGTAPLYTHKHEGTDDMPAHIKSMLTQASLCIPVSDGRLALMLVGIKRIVFPHQSVEPVFQIVAHGGIGILLNNKTGGGVLQKNRTQALAQSAFRHDADGLPAGGQGLDRSGRVFAGSARATLRGQPAGERHGAEVKGGPDRPAPRCDGEGRGSGEGRAQDAVDACARGFIPR